MKPSTWTTWPAFEQWYGVLLQSLVNKNGFYLPNSL